MKRQKGFTSEVGNGQTFKSYQKKKKRTHKLSDIPCSLTLRDVREHDDTEFLYYGLIYVTAVISSEALTAGKTKPNWKTPEMFTKSYIIRVPFIHFQCLGFFLIKGVPAGIVALSIAFASSQDGGIHSYVNGAL